MKFKISKIAGGLQNLMVLKMSQVGRSQVKSLCPVVVQSVGDLGLSTFRRWTFAKPTVLKIPLIALCGVVGGSVFAGSGGHVPGIGVDTAGTYLSLNRDFNAMGWEVPAFSSALDELGVEFLMDHYLWIEDSGTHAENYSKTAADIQTLAAWLKSMIESVKRPIA